MATPTVFISYSHDNEAHRAWVAALATRLQEKGVRVTLDQWDLTLGADVVAFMERGVASADRVLMICTERYVTKADSGVGGVGYERLIVSREIYERIETTKFIPVIRDNPHPKTPTFMGARLYVDLSEDSHFEGKFEELLKAIYGMPAIARPPLGPSPFSSILPAEATISTISASQLHIQGTTWTDQQASSAKSGLAKLGRSAGMEVRLQLTGTEQWSQLELYDAVKRAEIRTFGWPIGIVLEARDEYKPRPRSDGVYAEVAMTNKGFSQKISYDYWALRSDGTFYLLQSLFEDERTTNAMFFNTRIVRIAETLLFGGKLYQSLGLAPERQVIVRISHFGLKGRLLGSSNPNRPLMASHAASDDAVVTELPLRLDQMTSNVADSVARFCEPLFMIFDFQRFQRTIYDDIVGRFEAGEVV